MSNTQEILLPHLSDEEIVSKVIAGEHRLYEVIMRRYNARLFRVGMSIINNDAEIEDMMQVAYIKAYEHLHEFENRSAFGTWLTRIMINECLQQLKKNRRYKNVGQDNEMEMKNTENAYESTPVKALLNKELGKVLEGALMQLPEKYRLVFMLREVESMSIADTVTTLSITEANVKVRLNRAKTMLRDSLGNYYKNDGIFAFHLTRCDRVVNNVLGSLGVSISGQ